MKSSEKNESSEIVISQERKSNIENSGTLFNRNSFENMNFIQTQPSGKLKKKCNKR